MVISLFGRPTKRRSNKTGSRTAPESFISEYQWSLIEDLFPDPTVSRKGGRPRVTSRACLEGVIFVLKNGCRWKDLPERYPSPVTCWRRHREWTESGVWEKAWQRLLSQMDNRRRVDWSQAMGDGTFSPAKKGGSTLARPNEAKASS